MLIGAPAMIFINNKYTAVYFQIITRAQSRILPKDTYKERHHILPKCMGGSNKSNNLASLTAKEHFVCHRLLPNMVDDAKIKSKLMFAAWAMATQQPLSGKSGERRKCTSSYYAKLREHVANDNRLRQTGVSPGNKGVKQSEERKQKPVMLNLANVSTVINHLSRGLYLDFMVINVNH